MNSAARNLAWKLNWFRQSELEGALLLGRMVGMVEDAHLAARLTLHCAEEAGHSRLWTNVIGELDLPHIRIFRSYQSFYLEQSGAPASLVEVLCFTQIFERRVHRRFCGERCRPDTPTAARSAYESMIEDEKNHLGWVAAWLREQAGAPEYLRRYEEIDRIVFDTLVPYEQCLWEIPGLGNEPTEDQIRAA